jgi:hypothetical protein
MTQRLVRDGLYRHAAVIPVVTAIAATFLAGLIALARERRRELRNLAVAARVIHRACEDVRSGASIIAAREGDHRVEDMRITGTSLGISEAWKEHRNALASHMSEDAWNDVAVVLSIYLIAVTAGGPVNDAFANNMKNLAALAETAKQRLAPYCEKPGVLRAPRAPARINP